MLNNEFFTDQAYYWARYCVSYSQIAPEISLALLKTYYSKCRNEEERTFFQQMLYQIIYEDPQTPDVTDNPIDPRICALAQGSGWFD